MEKGLILLEREGSGTLTASNFVSGQLTGMVSGIGGSDILVWALSDGKLDQ